MNELMVLLGWVGIFAPMALATAGSIYGCAIAGQAAIGVMLDTETGYGKYIGVSVLPSTQSILGIVIMFTLNRTVTPQNAGGLFGIGLLSGIALMICGIQQGNCCASAINATKNKPEIFGLSIAPAAIVEGFAVFIFVFALVLSNGI
ncbi:ATP synthase subunit C [Fluoribacter dumoffii]|uniref:Sodium ATPase proteolipid component n=1 Tax=Fluoribacter dumoffii TaxID=463 RepID=A0A377GDM2_9GAMM|nr:ATP synthase subunit C [Fluoribacter dumoffii]KTC91206.1 V-type ATP synthase subunit K [Fluoribacter dumoffii NY 23]MCW8416828.1 ATP synthase subunit C [Fluoribacter dumoffii]MCW8455332.1 ATP synthase subunit C [Fluoribacter dumoffii]MCW8460590.1 ATP synthase subunit C [Fluoribacter dumoffii]MCW8484071.1 ATP synthase subunit C [Fluoribacter dumoffii]